jgi:lactate racemase
VHYELKKYILRGAYFMSTYSLKYGDKSIKFDIEGDVTSLIPKKTKVIEDKDIEKCIINSIENPINSKPLSKIVNPGEKVLFVVSDITRLWIKTDKFLIYIVNYLNSLWVKDEDISVIVAVGTHRGASEEEKKKIVGEELYNRINIYNHDSKDKDSLEYVGTSSYGTPAYINKKILEADRVILTGGITFHVFAGFGGGAKSMVPGVAGFETIQKNHKLVFKKGDGGLNLNARSNVIKGNPMREDITEICRKVSPDFLVNAVLDQNGNFVEFVSGDFEYAWLKGCNTTRDMYGIKIKDKADITIASAGGYPKDISLYQVVKSIDNSVYAGSKDSVLIIAAECREGIGADEFMKWFKYDTLEDTEKGLKENFTVPGFVAYKAMYAAKNRKVFLLSNLDDKVVEKLGYTPVKSIDEALNKAYELSSKNPNVVFIPYGGSTLPV